MDQARRLFKRIPLAPVLPFRTDRLPPRLAFFRRRVRLKGSSSISVPLGVVVLLFPCIVIALILVLVVRHPSPGRMLMPAGAPPSIRFVSLIPTWCADTSDADVLG